MAEPVPAPNDPPPERPAGGAQLRLVRAPSSHRVVQRARAVLAQELGYGLASLPGLARAVGVSARTLQRQLRYEGLTYQHLVDGARASLARQLLLEGQLGLGAVASVVGFADQSAFQRAFKRWLGITPGEYRARHRREPTAPPRPRLECPDTRVDTLGDTPPC